MKKTLLFFLFICPFISNAQAYQPGDVSIGLGSGWQLLSYDLSDTAGYRNYYDGLGGVNFSFHSELALAPFMGIGLTCSYSRLVSEIEAGNAACREFDFAPEVSYHVPWNNRFLDLSAATGLGISGYHYQLYEGNWLQEHISSTVYFAEARPRVYFTEKNRLGGFVYYRFTYYFGYGDAHDRTTPRYEFDAVGRGHTMGGGLFFRVRGISREKHDMN